MAKPLRVLIIEDSEKDTALLLRQLRGGGYEPSFERVETLAAMIAAVSNHTWDILISDHSMPHLSAIEALEAVKDRNLDIPVIILSGTIEEEKAIEAMRAGASDYIMKGNAARLLPAIERELREAEIRRNARKVEEQFRQSQKMEAMGRLAGGVAHDFNNLLTAISGYAEFVLRSLAPEDLRRADVEEIKKAAARAAGLTRQLLAFSRKQVLNFRTVDLNSVAADMQKMLSRVIGEDIELALSPSKEPALVKTDPAHIEQVILNLAVNAQDAMPRGGKLAIEISPAALDDAYPRRHGIVRPGRYFAICVSDTGCGMSEEVQAHLFEPFFTTKERGKGTGLGLPTVYGIVAQNEGHITVDSEEGKGTSIKVYLPRLEAPAVAEEKPRDSAVLYEGAAVILLVEDDAMVRKLARRVLLQSGFSLLEASRGEEALEICARHEGRIDLMLTDMVMPGPSGPELAGKVASLHPETKVLFMSGYTDHAVLAHGMLGEGERFIQKPFTPAALVEKIRRELAKPA